MQDSTYKSDSPVQTDGATPLPPDAHRILSVAISMIRQKDEQFHTYRIYTRQLIEFFPALLLRSALYEPLCIDLFEVG